jgi:hypothetical protein
MRVRFVRREPATLQPMPAMEMPAPPMPVQSRPRVKAAIEPDHTRSEHTRAWWPWMLLLMLIATGPVVYYVAEATYSSITVEAPGFLRQRQVVAYVPPAHLEYAVAGQRATVTLPDGTKRAAQVVEIPDTKRLIPADPYDNQKIGVLVRMRFTEDPAPNRKSRPPRLKDGLPVQVRFDPRVAAASQGLATKLQVAWNAARDQLKDWRSQAQR